MKKIIAIVMAVAFMATTVSPVSALTVEELQQQFNQLIAQLAQLQATGTAATGMPSACVGMTFTRDLSRNSVGNDVKCLQAVLNQLNVNVSNAGPGSPGNETTFFGDATKSAVSRYQTLNNIAPAAGYVGPITRASLNQNLSTFAATPPATPGCPAGALFNSMTGAPCTTPVPPVPGCPAGALFSSVTGAPCPTPSAPGTPVVGLTGTANIDAITDLSQYSGEDVGEGQTDVVVLGREIEMDNTGNARLQQVRVKFDHAGGTEVSGSSTRLQDYASKVSIMLNGTEVGSSAAVDFSRDSSGIYSRTILLNASAILNSDAKNDLLVAVSALGNLDSGDVTEEWNVNIENIRYVDATGAIITDSTTGDLETTETFSFDSLATSADLKLRFTVASNNPVATSVEVSTTVDTQDHTLIAFSLKAQGERIWIDELPVLFTVSSPTGLAEVDDIVAKASLKLGSATFSETLPAGCATGITCTVTFDSIDTWIEKDQLANASVVIDIQELAGLEFLAASSVKADITATERAAAVAEDANGNTVASASRTGVVTGELQTLYNEGIHVSNFTSSAEQTFNDSGVIVSTNFVLNYNVTAFGNTFYMPQTTAETTGTTEGAHYDNLLAGTIDTSTTPVASSISTTNATTVGSRFEIPEGATRSFSFQVLLDNSGTAGFYRVRLGEVGYVTVSSGGTVEYYTPAPAQSFETIEKKVD